MTAYAIQFTEQSGDAEADRTHRGDPSCTQRGARDQRPIRRARLRRRRGADRRTSVPGGFGTTRDPRRSSRPVAARSDASLHRVTRRRDRLCGDCPSRVLARLYPMVALIVSTLVALIVQLRAPTTMRTSRLPVNG